MNGQMKMEILDQSMGISGVHGLLKTVVILIKFHNL